MNSQLNPNAAVFIPVSPTRLLMMDDAIISASPGVEFEEPPVNIEYSSGPKQVDYFMRDNFSTFPNKIKELTTPPVCSVPDFTKNLQEHMEQLSVDKLIGSQNITQKDATGELGKANFFGITNISIDNESEDKNISGSNNITTTGSVEGNVSEDSALSETTTPLKVEVSCFPITEEEPQVNIQAENELNLASDKEICSEIILPKDGPLKGLTSQRKKSKPSRHRYKKRSKKVKSNVVESSEGFIIEHRRSPPIDLTFKPIQTFSDANPYGALQTPTTTTPTEEYYNLAELYKSPQETPKKGEAMCKPEISQLDIITKTPPSFILRRSPVDDSVVSFEELDSPDELPPFVHPPNANRIVSAMELPKSPEIETCFEILSSKSLEQLEVNTDADSKADFTEMKQDFNTDVANAENQETSFTSENTQVNKVLSKIDLETTVSFLRPEYTISQPKKECEQTPKLDIDLQSDNKTIPQDDSDIGDTLKSKAEEKNIPAFIDIKTDDPCGSDIFASFNPEHTEPELVSDHKTNVKEVMLDIFVEDTNLEMQETSFTNENTHMNKELMDGNSVSKKEFLEAESRNMHYKENFDQTSKINNDFKIDVETQKPEPNDTSSTIVLNEVNQIQTKYDNTDYNIKEETKEMRLELEAHIPTTQTTPEELRNLVQGFEVIDKDELIQENYLSTETEKVVDTSKSSLHTESKNEEVVNIDSPMSEALYSILKIDDVFTANESTSITQNVSVKDDQTSNNEFLKTIDKFSEAEDVELDSSEHSPSVKEPQKNITETKDHSSEEKEEGNKSILEDIVSEVSNPLQNPVSVAENKRSFEKEVVPSLVEIKSPLNTEYVQSALTQSMIVTETLNTSPEEVNRVPIIEMTEVPLIAGNDLTTLFSSGLNGKKLQVLSEIDVSITTTGEEADSRDKTDEEQMEKEEDPVELKKPVDGVSSRPSDTQTKQPAKPDGPTVRPAAPKKPSAVTKSAGAVKTTTPSPTTGKTSTVKPTASSTASTKPTASGSGSAKPTTTSVATSKPNASGGVLKPAVSSPAPSKPAALSTIPSKAAASNTVPLKPASSAVLSKPAAPSIAPSKSTTSSVPPSKHAASGVSPPKSSVSSVAPSKSSASTATLSRTSTTSVTPSKPAVSSGSPSKPVAPSKPLATSKSATSNLAPSKSADSSSTSVKLLVPSATTVKPAASSLTAAKPTATTTQAKKQAAATTVKPTGSKITTPSSTKTTVTSTTSSKSVPKQTPDTETTTTASKSPSKPSTPTSNPTTPTTPESPMVKSSTEKSPPKLETKSPLPATSSASPKPATEKSPDKKPATNSDVKSLVKKAEEPKSSTTVTTKSSAPTKASTPGTKTVGSATKSQTPTPNKTIVAKPAVITPTKQKPVGASDDTSTVSGSAGAKKSATATAAKTAEKNGKEPASGKMAGNGKTASTRTSSNVKTDPKGNTKNSEKSARSPSKKPEEGKTEEKSDQVQEYRVSTTNEIKNHNNDQQSTAQPLVHIVTKSVN